LTRWYGIRHLRYAWWQVRLAYYLFQAHGTDLRLPSQTDLDALDAIWEGKA
jgi:hypothetical protein